MAFNLNANANTTSNVVNGGFTKATAFINVYLPLANGKKHKMGMFMLYEGKQFDAAAIARIQEDPSSLEVLAGKLTFDFQLASGTPVEKADLPF